MATPCPIEKKQLPANSEHPLSHLNAILLPSLLHDCESPVPQQTQDDAALELAAANFAIPSDPTAFTLLPFDINLPPSIHDAKHTRRKDRKQKVSGKEKSKGPRPPRTSTAPRAHRGPKNTHPSLLALKNDAAVALKQLGHCGNFPDISLKVFRADNLHTDELDILISLGQAYSSYSMISLFYDRLPDHVLTRGSLTVGFHIYSGKVSPI
jgi:hypothetical protein